MPVIGLLAVALIAIAVIVGIIVLIVFLTKPSGNTAVMTEGDTATSYFDGNTFQYIGWVILAFLLTGITLGIAYPWAMCMLERWRVKHTVINGRRLKFTGTGAGLFGKYILWAFLTIITFGIYSIWFGLGMEKWKVKHTVFADGDNPVASRFTAGAGGWFGRHLLAGLIILVTFGIGTAWAQKGLIKWRLEHTEIGGTPLTFNGTGLQLLGKYLLYAVLTAVTFGIFSLFIYVGLEKWEASHTFALYRTRKFQALSRAHEENANKDFAKYKLAANNTELEILKSGLKGDESQEFLEGEAEKGNIYAKYRLSLLLDDERSLELLRESAEGGYHLAALDYAPRSSDKLAFLENSALGGNTQAAWLLSQELKSLAMGVGYGDRTALENLKKAAYWHKVAIEEEHPEAVSALPDYEKTVDRIALWAAGLEGNQGSGSSVGLTVVLVIVGVLAVLGIASILLRFIFGMGIGGVFVSRKEPAAAIDNTVYIEDFAGESYTKASEALREAAIPFRKIDVYSAEKTEGTVIEQDYKGNVEIVYYLD